MLRIAMIKNGVVANIAQWDGIAEWKPEGYTLIDITNTPYVDIGWNYDGNTFNAPVVV